MGSSAGFSKFLVVAGKLILMVSLFVLIGIPLLAGAGIGLLVFLLNIVSGLALSLFSNPIGLFLVGAVSLFLFNRRRRNQNRNQ